jgi:hypothetical protein
VLALRKMFGKGWWLQLDGKISEDFTKSIYANSPITYNTAAQPQPSVGLSVGIPIP